MHLVCTQIASYLLGRQGRGNKILFSILKCYWTSLIARLLFLPVSSTDLAMAATPPSPIDLQEAEDYLRRLNASPPVFKFWSPPEDPGKPRLPYIPGFTVEIRRHVPPPPFGGPHYGKGTRQGLSGNYLRGATHSELVIDHPGLGTPLPASSETAQLTVMTLISVGEVRGAQIVACEISSQDEGNETYRAVAKIYDPMYYSFECNSSHQPHDTVCQADSDYSREAAAYEHLQKNVSSSSFAPQYFGSWTFDLIIRRGDREVSKTRPVRMILMERLDGMSTMRDMRVRNSPIPEASDDAFHYPEDFRLEVLAVAMDGYARMLHSGLDQRDFASRNIMLDMSVKRAPFGQDVPMVSGIPLPRIVLVGYNTSIVHSLRTAAQQGDHLQQHRTTPLPINPMQLWWGMPMNEFVGWVPHEWHSTPRLKREWLQKRFGGMEQRKLYTMDREPHFENDELEMEATLFGKGTLMKDPGDMESTASTHQVVTKASGADSSTPPQSRARGSHEDTEDTPDPSVVLKCIPWNPRSDEMKRLKQKLQHQDKL